MSLTHLYYSFLQYLVIRSLTGHARFRNVSAITIFPPTRGSPGRLLAKSLLPRSSRLAFLSFSSFRSMLFVFSLFFVLLLFSFCSSPCSLFIFVSSPHFVLTRNLSSPQFSFCPFRSSLFALLFSFFSFILSLFCSLYCSFIIPFFGLPFSSSSFRLPLPPPFRPPLITSSYGWVVSPLLSLLFMASVRRPSGRG